MALLVADFAIVFICFYTAHWYRVEVLSRFAFFRERGELASVEVYLFFVSIYILALGSMGLYYRRLSWIEESTLLLRACFYATASAMVLSSLARVTSLFSRAVVAVASLLVAVALPLGRYAVKSALGRWKAWQRPVVLLGANSNGLRAAEDMSAERTTGLCVVGIFTDRPLDSVVPFPIWRVPNLDEAIEFCREQGLRSFVVCEDEQISADLPRVVRLLETFSSDIKVAAAQPSLHSLRMQSEVLKSSYLFSASNPLSKAANRFLKRSLDLVFGTVLCLLFLPVFWAAPILIRLSSRGPVFFRQERIGLEGRQFCCWKFRTMYQDAEERLKQIFDRDEGARAQYFQSFKLRCDPRVTPVGSWLRKTSLDELPQLWNVLRGDMSLVGPRPPLVEEVVLYDLDLASNFRAPCGLTGLWQISGRSDLSRSERVRLDVFYIRNWSIWLDLVILARTAWQMIRPRGAY